MNQTIYTLLLWALPILLTILGFIGALAVNALMKLSSDVSEIKKSLAVANSKNEEHEHRIVRLEDKIFS